MRPRGWSTSSVAFRTLRHSNVVRAKHGRQLVDGQINLSADVSGRRSTVQ
jgi:hypothetical protein